MVLRNNWRTGSIEEISRSLERSVRRSGYLKIYFGQEDSYVVYDQEITENRYK